MKCPICKHKAIYKKETYKNSFRDVTIKNIKVGYCTNPKHPFSWLPNEEEEKINRANKRIKEK